MRGWIATAVSIVTLLSVPGCTEEPRKLLGDQCDLNSQCETPLVCRIAHCRRQCATTRDCPIGSLCVKDADGLGACLLEVETRCERASDCPEPLVCLGGGCTEECVENRDCAPGADCVEGDDGARWCEDPAEQRCTRHGQCPEGLRCAVDGRCRASCRSDRDCREGQRCDQETRDCVRITFPDAGMDAGPEEDAGPDDAGTDAGSADAGPDDAGADAAECGVPSDCTAPNVDASDCVAGTCTIATCSTGFDDCNGDYADGCEQDVSSDPDNCGTCGGSCGLGGACSSGSCDTVVDVALGMKHMCVLRSSGAAFCQGYNDAGELGRGTTGTREIMFAMVSSLSTGTDLDLGAASSCGILSDGSATCWGDNGYGQLGDGTTTGRPTPVAVTSLTGVAQIEAGGDYVRLGSGTVLSAVAEEGFTCARRSSDGTVWCWGFGERRGDGVTADTSTPVEVTGLTSATDLTAGTQHACAVHGGNVSCWGAGGPWLGDGGATAAGTVADTPVSVSGIGDAVAVDAGRRHTCAVHATGAVSCWGDNVYGEVGDGVAVGSAVDTPATVSGITDAVDVAVEEYHSCALRSTGEVACWGDNFSGALGDGTTTASATPVAASGVTDATSIHVDRLRTCILRGDGAVVCWGEDGRSYGIDCGFTCAPWHTPMIVPDFPPTPSP